MQRQKIKFIKIKVDLNSIVSTISGGQLTQLFLTKVKLSNADIILLDEPTNNLDADARINFIKWLSITDKYVVIASHDRELLNHMDNIISIDNNKLDFYTGNYHSYKSHKNILQQAIVDDINHAENRLKK